MSKAIKGKAKSFSKSRSLSVVNKLVDKEFIIDGTLFIGVFIDSFENDNHYNLT